MTQRPQPDSSDLDTLLAAVLRPAPDAMLRPFVDLGAWWRAFRDARRHWDRSIDQAVVGGLQADRVGYAFAAAYQSALRCLVPSLPDDRLVSLCITEKGGGHPRAIQSTLSPIADGPSAGGWMLSGHKKWATLSCDGDMALVAASVGTDTDGLNELRVVQVGLDAVGVTACRMPATSFAPEITHGQLSFENVHIAPDAVLPGDGYTDYIRPFRTVEDTHVSAAILGHLIGIASRFAWPQSVRADLVNLVVNLRSIAMGDPSAPEIHVVLGGFFTAYGTVLERIVPCWERVPREMRERWQRDREIVNVAGTVRGKRLEAAWRRIDAPGHPG
jgi:acyl-CoA dehydrogenase